MIPNKTCSRCGETKPLSDFTKRTRSKDGYTAACTECCRKGDRDYYSRNREQVIAKTVRHYHENVAHYQKYKQMWKANHRAEAYGLEARISLADVEAVYVAQDNTCATCGEPLGECKDTKPNLDHIIGFQEGGDNVPENLAIRHQKCHHEKNGEELGRRNKRQKNND